jgi:NAD(P)-dependent dehydrogenase (short-subunit alcohol dehydrogenase family)
MAEWTTTDAPPRAGPRLLASMRGQAARTSRCPDTPRLDGRLAVVTGATGGIGLEIARGLRARGADLVLPCRSRERGERLVRLLREDAPGRGGAGLERVDMDMEDLTSVGAAAEAIARAAAGRPVELLVENAGVWPSRYRVTAQGHEIAFGVNVLAHFALRRVMQRAGVLDRARVVVLTGDIYVRASACTPDFVWRGRRGGMQAYCRSKLGNLWIAGELARRHPALHVVAVHPGVVATDLGGALPGPLARLRERLFVPAELGAQTPLRAATQEGLESGAYVHNTMGRMRLHPGDPARDTESAAALWETCSALAGV